MTAGRLVFPGLRWQAATGFEHEWPGIERALAFGAGGFILFGGTVAGVRALTDRLARAAGRPLLIGADLERGAGQQVEGLPELPPPRALASLGDFDVIEAAGALTARAARTVGINWIYAPVCDLDLESENPIVQTRAFGDRPEPVGAAVARWIAGCQQAGALACAKHFPGHGRTRSDSHDRLAVVDASRAELEAADLMPFRAAIRAEVRSVMTAHVAFPALDPDGAPATRSPAILGVLRQEWGFDGLVVSDALTMEGVRGGLSPEAASIAAVRAGVDCLLYPPDPPATAAALARAADDDPMLAERVERSAARVDAALAWIAGAAANAPTRAPKLDPAVVAMQLLGRTAPARLRLRAPLELLIVDDDLDGAFPPTSSGFTAQALAAGGVALGSGGSRVVLAFAEPRASKGRGGFGPASVEALAELVPGADLVVLFAHERLVAMIPGGPPVVVAWHRQRLMQEALARWLAERVG